MPSFSATSSTSDGGLVRTVVFVVYPGVKLLDLTGPLQVFADASGVCVPGSAYNVTVVSGAGGLVETDTPIPIPSKPVSRKRGPIHTLLIAGGTGAREASRDQHLVENVRRLAARSERAGSVCTGAFVLAASGVLNGRRAVTHWESCAKLANDFPLVRVESDPIFIKDENVWTCAGVTAGIDLALAMVAEDFGRSAALTLARLLVSYMVRPGGQSQFSGALDRQLADAKGRFDALHEWVFKNLDSDLRVERLAERVNMSSRNFARAYAAETGRTPAKAIEAIRAEAARGLLEETTLPVSIIAERCGFRDDERMRRAFLRTLRVSPSDYRHRFKSEAAGRSK